MQCSRPPVPICRSHEATLHQMPSIQIASGVTLPTLPWVKRSSKFLRGAVFTRPQLNQPLISRSMDASLRDASMPEEHRVVSVAVRSAFAGCRYERHKDGSGSQATRRHRAHAARDCENESQDSSCRRIGVALHISGARPPLRGQVAPNRAAHRSGNRGTAEEDLQRDALANLCQRGGLPDHAVDGAERQSDRHSAGASP
jgi:hypothetical protein